MMQFLQSLSLISRSLAVACGLLLTIIVMEVYFIGTGKTDANAAVPDVTATGGAITQGTRNPPYQAPGIAAYAEITDRPVFTNTRRPPPVEDAPEASARADQILKKWKLTGVVVAEDSSYVHVENIRERKTERLKKGGLLDGWRLQEIFPDRVILVSGSDDVILELRQEEKPAAPRPRR